MRQSRRQEGEKASSVSRSVEIWPAVHTTLGPWYVKERSRPAPAARRPDCQALDFPGAGDACRTGGHNDTGSGQYAVEIIASPDTAKPAWRFCHKCRVLHLVKNGVTGACHGDGTHVAGPTTGWRVRNNQRARAPTPSARSWMAIPHNSHPVSQPVSCCSVFTASYVVSSLFSRHDPGDDLAPDSRRARLREAAATWRRCVRSQGRPVAPGVSTLQQPRCTRLHASQNAQAARSGIGA